MPLLGFEEVTIYNLLWLAIIVVFSVIALYQLRHIKKYKLIAKWYRT